MYEAILPKFAGGRRTVAPLLEDNGIPQDLKGFELLVHCQSMNVGTESFADELVKEVLLRRDAKALVLLSPPASFEARVVDAARDFGVSERIVVQAADRMSV